MSRSKRDPRSGLGVVLILILGLMLVACSGDKSSGPEEDSGPEENTTSVLSVEHLSIPTSTWKPGDLGMQSGVRGLLSIDSADCLVLRLPSSRSVAMNDDVPVVWPAGFEATRVEGEGFELVDADGNSVAVEGDRVSFGGGFVDPDQDVGLSPHRCLPATGRVFVVQDEVALLPS